MSWLAFVGPLLFAVALMVLPGLPIAFAAGARGFAAAALAPALSITAIGVGAIAGDLAGVRWGWWTPAVASLVFAALAWGARRLLKRWIQPGDTRASLRRDWPLWVSVALAALLWARHVRNVFDRPDAFSQTFDNIFHLSLIRYMAETGTGSSLAVEPLTPATFYPAAFHDIASLVFLSFPDSITVALAATVWATVAVAWPLSCLHLLTTLTRMTSLTAISAGVLTAAFTGFPLLLLEFGVLYPNVLGFVLLPTAVGLAVDAIGLGHRTHARVQALLAGALVVPGMILAHPSALLSFFAVGLPLLVVGIVRGGQRIRQGGAPAWPVLIRIGLMAICIPVIMYAWVVARPIEAPWLPGLSRTDAVGQVVLNAPLGNGPAWVVSLLMLVGIVAAWQRRQGWLVAAWGVTVLLWIVCASGPAGEIRDLLTGPYYNDLYRLAALFTVMALPLAAVGLDQTVGWLASHATRFAPRLAPRAVEAAVGVLVLAALVATTQRVPYMNEAVQRASDQYALTDDAALLSIDEYALIQRVPTHVEEGAVVATDPLNGSSLLYAFTGVPTTIKHVFYPSTPELDVLNQHFDDAALMPEVCPAAHTLGVRYALAFGNRGVHGPYEPFPGFLELADNPGISEVDREGDAVLYRLDFCWP